MVHALEPIHSFYDEPLDPPLKSDEPLAFVNPVRGDGVRFGDIAAEYHATFYDHTVTMENGTRYEAMVAIPAREVRGASDIAYVETTAWTTRPDGLNKEYMDALAKLAIPSVCVSVQQNTLRFGDINKSAHDQLEIYRALERWYNFDSAHVLLGGISRGGMHGLAATAVAPQHGMHVPYNDEIVPVRLDGVDLYRDMGQLSRAYPYELMAMSSLLCERSIAGLVQLSRTFDITPHGVLQQLKEIPTLLSGDTGRMIDRYLARDTFGYITAYDDDMFTSGSSLRERFDGERYPNMILDTTTKGGHMSCALGASQEARVARMRTVSELLHDLPQARQMGGAALRSLAAERDPVFRLPGETTLGGAA